MTDQEQITAFLARKGVTMVAAAPAYGVDKAVDRERRASQRAANAEAAHERQLEAAHDAFFTGDREEGFALMSGFERVAPGRYVSRRFDRF